MNSKVNTNRAFLRTDFTVKNDKEVCSSLLLPVEMGH